MIIVSRTSMFSIKYNTTNNYIILIDRLIDTQRATIILYTYRIYPLIIMGRLNVDLPNSNSPFWTRSICHHTHRYIHLQLYTNRIHVCRLSLGVQETDLNTLHTIYTRTHTHRRTYKIKCQVVQAKQSKTKKTKQKQLNQKYDNT